MVIADAQGVHWMQTLIKKNSSIPCEVEKEFWTEKDYQEKVSVIVMEGTGGDLASENTELGEFTIVLNDLSLKPAGKDRIIITLEIDANYSLICDAVDKRTMKKNKLELLWNSVLSLTDEELEEARKRVDD